MEWIMKIVARDLVYNIIFINIWAWYVDWNASTHEKLNAVRFIKESPSRDSYWREVPNTISTILFGSLFECLALNWYANDVVTNYYMNHWEHPWWSFFWIGCMSSWRDGHFFVIHRMMHPWNTADSKYFIVRCIPDVGQFLFKYGHSLHHLSENTTIWSG